MILKLKNISLYAPTDKITMNNINSVVKFLLVSRLRLYSFGKDLTHLDLSNTEIDVASLLKMLDDEKYFEILPQSIYSSVKTSLTSPKEKPFTIPKSDDIKSYEKNLRSILTKENLKWVNWGYLVYLYNKPFLSITKLDPSSLLDEVSTNNTLLDMLLILQALNMTVYIEKKNPIYDHNYDFNIKQGDKIVDGFIKQLIFFAMNGGSFITTDITNFELTINELEGNVLSQECGSGLTVPLYLTQMINTVSKQFLNENLEETMLYDSFWKTQCGKTCEEVSGGYYTKIDPKNISERDYKNDQGSCNEKVLCGFTRDGLRKALTTLNMIELLDKVNFTIKIFGTAPMCDPDPLELINEGFIPLSEISCGNGSCCWFGSKILALSIKTNDEKYLKLWGTLMGEIRQKYDKMEKTDKAALILSIIASVVEIVAKLLSAAA